VNGWRDPGDLSLGQLLGGVLLALLVVGAVVLGNLEYGRYLGCAVEVGGVGVVCS